MRSRTRVDFHNRIKGVPTLWDQFPDDYVVCGLEQLLTGTYAHCQQPQKTSCNTCPVYTGAMGNPTYKEILKKPIYLIGLLESLSSSE